MRTPRNSRRGQPNSSSLKRRAPTREPRARILIVCEGRKTEPTYFRVLCKHRSLSAAEVSVCGEECGSHPTFVVECARKRKKQAVENKEPYDRVWCVFDRDDHAKIHEALTRAKHLGINVAFSNPCFELWFLLHFDYSSGHVGRRQAQSRLKQYINDYRKSMPVYEMLLPGQQTATDHAHRLRSYHDGVPNPPGYNPSTTVDQLVTELNALAQRQ